MSFSISSSNLSLMAKTVPTLQRDQVSAPISRNSAWAQSARNMILMPWVRVRTRTRGFPHKKEADVNRSLGAGCLRFRVFAWVAREPELMCGAKGRASSTEINRLTQLNSTPNAEFAVLIFPLVTADL